MFLSKLNRILPVLLGGVLCYGVLLHQEAAFSQPRPEGSQPPSRPAAKQEERTGSKSKRLEIPAPRELKATAGRGKVLVYALDEAGNRIEEGAGVPPGGAVGLRPQDAARRLVQQKEVDREVRWVVVIGVVDHHRIREVLGEVGRNPLPPSFRWPNVPSVPYKRVDLERQRLQMDGTWSDWELVDFEATLKILDNMPEADAELIPEELLSPNLVDPLPYLKSGVWQGVDVERFVPSSKIRKGGRQAVLGPQVPGLIQPPRPAPRAESPVLMLRSFDFAVEPGRIYRYRARVEIFYRTNSRYEIEGDWSSPTEPVTVP